MFIESLALNNYRNYDYLDIDLSKGTNILYGDNAQGKTNILESIYMAATTKSHRNSRDKEIIMFEKEESHIRLMVNKNDISHRIDMHLKKNKNKGVAVDSLPIRKIAELFGLLNIIFFSPEDLSIIKNGPVERRRFMDMELCQLSRLYYSNLANYNKILNQRNNLLKQIHFNKSLIDTLDVWDMQIAKYGYKVIKERENFINMLEEIVVDIHQGLTSGKEKLEIKYNKSINEESYEDILKEKRSVDCKYESTQYGPHRDDISFFINDMDVRMYGSQGQQRTAALSLKLAEIELVKKIINDNPVLLLDDVMSELDTNRRNALLNTIKDVQTIITCTGYDDFIKERISIDKIYYIKEGKATLKSI
ncbi:MULTISPECIES: DNA replication/repair protein RecF [Eubacterium]|uniref:DNA replication and repair protein RecF n=1 Tax=Eubacterium ruminantium TaxID=42322 RepID=A0A1T4N396_9FIRM|nr:MULTISPECIES: DNA replication/repair protein RecF [Eubacterium]MCR5367265.1 DNA replication/repair protein RecF [Eubacterium sp.]SCW51669.1 DNA replication and repair protein RecF [Eubacterium ruminantium]SDM66675.1 DNA replication and repair protein RecF [Eubacterium ruminantium]SJZ73604.1 DNA replication and repair protein RecF [Eubacterium ruminantium]